MRTEILTVIPLVTWQRLELFVSSGEMTSKDLRNVTMETKDYSCDQSLKYWWKKLVVEYVWYSDARGLKISLEIFQSTC